MLFNAQVTECYEVYLRNITHLTELTSSPGVSNILGLSRAGAWEKLVFVCPGLSCEQD